MGLPTKIRLPGAVLRRCGRSAHGATGGTIDAQMPARSLVSIDDVGAATACLAHDAARLITGETLYIDGGYHIIDYLDASVADRTYSDLVSNQVTT